MFYGKDNSIKLMNGNTVQIIALAEDDRDSEEESSDEGVPFDED